MDDGTRVNGTPPMPASQAEWAAHWAFYKLTLAQRNAAWLEVERLRIRADHLHELYLQAQWSRTDV